MAASTIKPDEVILFFHTCAWRAPDAPDTWVLPIRGIVFEPEADSRVRDAFLRRLRDYLGLSDTQATSTLYQERARPFVVDHERGKRLAIRLGGRTLTLPPSGADGHFAGELRLRDAEVRPLFESPTESNPWVPYQAVTARPDRRVFAGAVQLLKPEGLSVVSDIDDTMKVSHCLDRARLLDGMFLRDFRAVDGMPALYARWAAQGAAFHYVSAGIWQFYEPLAAFCATAGFPRGSMHLQPFRIADGTADDAFEFPERKKRGVLAELLRNYPRRRFLLVGDSGQKDPELYAELARAHPDQVQRVLIRDITNEPAEADRYRTAFEGLPRDRWQIFREAREIDGAL